MKTKTLLFAAMLLAITLVVCSCGTVRRNTMEGPDIYKVPAAVEGNYLAVIIPVHDVQKYSEGTRGVRLEYVTEDKKKYGGIILLPAKDVPGSMAYLLVVISEASDPNFLQKKGIVTSRSGVHSYLPDGENEFGGNNAPLDWKFVKPLGQYSQVTVKRIAAGSNEDMEIRGVREQANEYCKGKPRIPGMMSMILSSVGSLSPDEILLAVGGTVGSPLGTFASLGAVKLYSIINIIQNKADRNLVYYDSAPVNRHDLAEAMVYLERKITGIKQSPGAAGQSVQVDPKLLKRYEEDLDIYEKNYLQGGQK